MRGREKPQRMLFSAATIETLVDNKLPIDHPLRRIKAQADAVLQSLSADFDLLYAKSGRPSIPPERLLRALLWMALFSVRSERLLEDTLRFDLRCRWFVGLSLDEDAFDHSTFSKARETVVCESIAELFFERHLVFLRAEGLLSSEHLSVDGSLLNAWASHKSMVKREDFDKDGRPPPPPAGGRNGWVDFKGKGRSNETHVSATDPEARLASKGCGAKLSHELHVLAENRNNFAIAVTVTAPTGTSEREAALHLVSHEISEGRKPETLGADRKYSDGDKLVEALMNLSVAAHFAVRDDRPKALARIYENEIGYRISLKKRMRIEEIFGYIKSICGMAAIKVRGAFRVYGKALLALATYNLVRRSGLAAT